MIKLHNFINRRTFCFHGNYATRMCFIVHFITSLLIMSVSEALTISIVHCVLLNYVLFFFLDILKIFSPASVRPRKVWCGYCGRERGNFLSLGALLFVLPGTYFDLKRQQMLWGARFVVAVDEDASRTHCNMLFDCLIYPSSGLCGFSCEPSVIQEAPSTLYTQKMAYRW